MIAVAGVLALGGAWAAVRRLPREAEVRNGGFEDGLEGWTAKGAARADATAARSGAAGALLDAPPNVRGTPPRESRISQAEVAVRRGRAYRFQGWARGRGAPTLELWLVRGRRDRFRAGTWTALGSDWTLCEAEWTSPRDGEISVEWALRGGEAPVPVQADLDDVAVAEIAVPSSFDVTGDASPFEDEPSIARSPDGSFWVARLSWRGHETLRAARLLARPDGSFEMVADHEIEGGPGTAVIGPRLVAGPDAVWLVYSVERGDDWQIAAVPLTADGPGTRIEFGNGAATDVRPAAALDGNALVVAWESNAGGERGIWTATVQDGRAGTAEWLGSGWGPARSPTVAVTEPGAASFAWHTARAGTDIEIAAAGVRGGGSTSSPLLDRRPFLAARGRELWIAWEQATTKGIRIGHTFDRRTVIARVDAETARLGTPEHFAATAPPFLDGERAALAFDATGRLRVVYLRPRRADHAWQVWETSWDGLAWTKPRVLSSRKGLSRTPGVAVDGTDVVVAFQTDDLCGSWSDIDRTPEARSRVEVVRVRGTDAPRPVTELPTSPYAEPRDPYPPETARTQFGDGSVAARTTELDGAPATLLFGNLHEHSDTSICGKLMDDDEDWSWQSIRDFPHLDFGVLTDHGENFNAYLWHRSAKEARAHDDPGRFTTFVGEEWTSSFEETSKEHPFGFYGHRNLVIGDLRFPRWFNPRDRTTPAELFAALRASGSDFVVIPHQLADTGNVPTDWSFTDDVAQPVAEIFQYRGSYEVLGGPRAAENGIREPGSYLQDAWKRGIVIGVIAAPDHGGGHGKAAVWARDRSRKAILDALRARHCYGTTGSRIALEVRVNGRLMGDEDLAPAERIEVRVRVEAPADVASVEVCRDGTFHGVPFVPGTSVDVAWADPTPPPRRTWTYVRVTLADGEIAWSSPVWNGPRAAAR